MRNVVVGAMVFALAAPAARAQGGGWGQDPQYGEQQQREQARSGSSDALLQACMDLMNGRLPEGGEQAVQGLRRACSDLMQARAEEQRRAEDQRELARMQQEGGTGQQAQVEPGRAVEQPQAGTGVLAAFEQAGRELVSPRRGRALGMGNAGPFTTTVVTNPIGWFSGMGVNLELHRSYLPRVSWIAGGRFSRTDASNGTATTFGAMGGADLYIFGRNNEGLRIGPRLEVALGRENFQSSTNFARLGLAGELGYNFIATNGITGMLGAGLGGRIAGDDENENFGSFTGGEFGPYVKVGLGFSW